MNAYRTYKTYRTYTPYLCALLLTALATIAHADGRPGVIEWSDGHKQTGAISLTGGKNLRVYFDNKQVSITLDQVKQIRFLVEKEQMWEGFYFPNAGQATQVKTGDVYPIRYLKAELTLGNGQVVAGYLESTVFYVEDADGTAQKVVVLAKQSGPDGQKLADLLYPTAIRFDAGAASTSSAVIDLTPAGLTGAQPPVFLTQPDLTLLAAQPTQGKPIWTVPLDDPAKLIFSVEASDGIHVAWPAADIDALAQASVEKGLRDMRDFYDTRTLLGSFPGQDATDIYSLVMMKRIGKTHDGDGNAFTQTPWSLVVLRWKYDPDTMKVLLLNRAMLAIGRSDAKTPEPTILREPALLKDVSQTK